MNSLKQDALVILRSALAAADAGNAVRRHFSLPYGAFDRIVLLAAGKAACPMAEAVQTILGDRLNAALVITKHGHVSPTLRGAQIIEAGHPVPDEQSLQASREATKFVRDLNEQDLLIVAVSGGASALLSAPAPPVTLAGKQSITDRLLRAGANIHELNAVRKHISTLKGGQLAALAYPATVIALLLSDVIGDRLDVIGSGLTAPDPTTTADATAVLQKFGLLEAVPISLHETPKPGDPVFKKVRNIIVGSNRLALEAAAETAASLGYSTNIRPAPVEGEALLAAREHAAVLKRTEPPACILSGGETTVKVHGNGKGGRNQEFALAAAIEIAGYSNIGILCAGTDGTDGPTDAAGAFANSSTLERASRLGLSADEFLANNDSYHFFEGLGDLVKTGPTGTNVMDINIMLAQKS